MTPLQSQPLQVSELLLPAPNLLITEKGFPMVSPFANRVKVYSVELIIEEFLSGFYVQFPFFSFGYIRVVLSDVEF